MQIDLASLADESLEHRARSTPTIDRKIAQSARIVDQTEIRVKNLVVRLRVSAHRRPRVGCDSYHQYC
ncbi:hypothetical protein Bra5_PB00236 (plasmid) [Rhizobium phaseoli Brasil 5]|nr:hypothetical protein Bra5_PB00236 [Rhizobium phaseoli Brasil 5]